MSTIQSVTLPIGASKYRGLVSKLFMSLRGPLFVFVGGEVVEFEIDRKLSKILLLYYTSSQYSQFFSEVLASWSKFDEFVVK